MLDEMREGLDPRLIRDTQLLIATPVQHRRALRVRVQRGLCRETRLTDPRLTLYQHQPTLPTACIRQRAVDHPQFVVAAHHRRRIRDTQSICKRYERPRGCREPYSRPDAYPVRNALELVHAAIRELAHHTRPP